MVAIQITGALVCRHYVLLHVKFYSSNVYLLWVLCVCVLQRYTHWRWLFCCRRYFKLVQLDVCVLCTEWLVGMYERVCTRTMQHTLLQNRPLTSILNSTDSEKFNKIHNDSNLFFSQCEIFWRKFHSIATAISGFLFGVHICVESRKNRARARWNKHEQMPCMSQDSQ